MITNQAKWAIEKMRNAGWSRNEFRVRTDTRRYQRNGHRVTEYGDAMIGFRNHDRARQVEMIAPMIKAGLNVTLILSEHGWSVLVNDLHGKRPLTILDLTTDDIMKRWVPVPVVLPELN